MIYSHVGSSDLFLILGLNDLQFLVLGLIHFEFLVFYGELIKPSSLNQISPTRPLLTEPITGWLLRPIFRLILTGYIYSRYMYDGIEHFDYVLHIGSRILKHLQTKVPKVHSN